MPKYDLYTIQKEVFEYLIYKKEELYKQGIEFAFDLMEIETYNYTEILRGNYFELDDITTDDGEDLDYFSIDFYDYDNLKKIAPNGLESFSSKKILEESGITDLFYFLVYNDGTLLVSLSIKNNSNIKNNFNFRRKLKKIIKNKGDSIHFIKESWKENFDDFFKYYPKIYELIKNELNYENEIETSFREKYKQIIKIKENYDSLHLTSFSINNFQGIKHIEINNIPKTTKWIFLTGKNAFGKTSILQALAGKLGGLHNSNINYSNFAKSGINYKLDIGFEEIEYGFSEYIVAYGPNRLLVTSQGAKKSNSVEQIFTEGYEIPLRNYELYFSRWYFKQTFDNEFKEKYKYVKQVMLKLLPNVVNIEVTKYDEVIYTETDENGDKLTALPLSKLASGMKGIIAMVGDMILRLFESQPHINNPSELTGIVIIDELDLHLHPTWQRKFPNLLSSVFPKVQFITSTHSAIPLLGAPKNSIILNVQRDKKQGITLQKLSDNLYEDAKYSDVSALLLNFFDNSPVISNNLENILKQFYALKINEQLTEEQKNELQNIEKELDNTFVGINIHDYRFLKFLKLMKKMGYDPKKRLPDIELSKDEIAEFRKEFEEYYQ